jgi:hypothetical protein
MERNQNDPDLAQAEATRSPTLLQAIPQQFLVPPGFKPLTKVIDIAEQGF